MDAQLRKDMLAFLTPLLSMQTERGRRALLLSAGLDGYCDCEVLYHVVGKYEEWVMVHWSNEEKSRVHERTRKF